AGCRPPCRASGTCTSRSPPAGPAGPATPRPRTTGPRTTRSSRHERLHRADRGGLPRPGPGQDHGLLHLRLPADLPGRLRAHLPRPGRRGERLLLPLLHRLRGAVLGRRQRRRVRHRVHADAVACGRHPADDPHVAGAPVGRHRVPLRARGGRRAGPVGAVRRGGHAARLRPGARLPVAAADPGAGPRRHHVPPARRDRRQHRQHAGVGGRDRQLPDAADGVPVRVVLPAGRHAGLAAEDLPGPAAALPQRRGRGGPDRPRRPGRHRGRMRRTRRVRRGVRGARRPPLPLDEELMTAPARGTLPHPMTGARDALQEFLDARFGAGAPRVVPVGAVGAGGGDAGAPDPWAADRPDALVHVTASAVLLGPWGGDGRAPACGRCLALRWQRLRSRSERNALETGGPQGPRPAGDWPVLTGHVRDAVAALCEALLHGPRPVAPAADPADRALPRVTRLDLANLTVRTYPLLADPLCPSCAGRPRPRAAHEVRPLSLVPRPKPDPDGYRLRPASAHPLPTDALANPVCGALGAGTWTDVTSSTTAPVAGSAFVRGYAGLHDVTWSGQENSFATSRRLAFLEGLERYAGTHRRGGSAPVTGSYEEVKADAVDPAVCGLYAPETYRDD